MSGNGSTKFPPIWVLVKSLFWRLLKCNFNKYVLELCISQIEKAIVKNLIQICCSLYEWNVATGERMHEVEIVIFGIFLLKNCDIWYFLTFFYFIFWTFSRLSWKLVHSPTSPFHQTGGWPMNITLNQWTSQF